MALKNSEKSFPTKLKDLKGVTEFFAAYFEEKGYQISCEETAGGTFISMTKGGLFRAISGLKTGLNITLAQLPESVNVKMEIGIFGKQWLPGTIATFLFWPVLVTQMIGLIQQNKLDQEAYQVLEKGIQACQQEKPDFMRSESFCMHCGKRIPADSVFCPHCGKKVQESIQDEANCHNCGIESPDGSAFCPQCGVKTGKEDAA